MARQRRIKAVLMRGGTSRGVFFHRDDLPADPAVRDRLILKVFGGGDPYGRQIDGLGGASSITSKVVMVGPPSVADADVDYTFGQVSVTTPYIDYGGTCGNLTAAIGPFAIEEGMVRGTDPVTAVRIWQTNTRKRILAHIPTADGLPLVEGGCAIDGIPGTGAEIVLEFFEPGGAMTAGVLPTGHPSDLLEVPGLGRVTVSLVDAVNPCVFVPAAALGLTGIETPDRVDGDQDLLRRIEAVRGQAAVAMGIARTPDEATAKSPGVPKLAIVSRPAAYRSTRGTMVGAQDVDVVCRIMSMGRLHRAYAASGAACTAVAALIEGTVVHDAGRPGASGLRTVRLGHPAGVIEIGAAVRKRDDGGWFAEKVITRRTARRLMEGYACVPAAVWPAGVPAARDAERAPAL